VCTGVLALAWRAEGDAGCLLCTGWGEASPTKSTFIRLPPAAPSGSDTVGTEDDNSRSNSSRCSKALPKAATHDCSRSLRVRARGDVRSDAWLMPARLLRGGEP